MLPQSRATIGRQTLAAQVGNMFAEQLQKLIALARFRPVSNDHHGSLCVVLRHDFPYATTSIPIERAVPLMLLIAVSTEAAFRSGIFWVAMSRTCFRHLADLVLVRRTGALASPAAFFNRTAAGGVLVTNENVRSV